MLQSMGTSWLWGIPHVVLLYFAFFTTLLTFSTGIYGFNPKSLGILLVYVLITTIKTYFSPDFGLSVIFVNFVQTIVIISVILLKDSYKIDLFNWFVKILSFILLITIFAWLLFLAGFSFSHGKYVDLGDGYHYLLDYKFFVVSETVERGSFMRFSSVFVEPGWIGTICCFTIFGMSINFKRIPFWLCLAGLLLSISLSAVVNLLVCGLLWIWQTSKHRLIWLSLFLLTLIGFFLFAINYKNGDNAINELIVERLVYDEDVGIVGNNRTDDAFDYEYEDVIGGGDKWFGIAYKVDKQFRETNEWYNSSSGIKKEIITNGYIGTGLFLLFLVLLLIHYRSKQSFIFFVCFIMASFIRDMWRSDCYLVLYIVSLCVLFVESQNNKVLIKKNNVRVVKKQNHQRNGMECC